MEPTTRTLIGPRAVFAAMLWLVAAAVVGLVLAGESSPLWADRIAGEVGSLLSTAALVAAVLVGVALLIWPPFVPGMRVWIGRLRDRMSVDQGPMLAARERLQHFDSAPEHLTIGRTLLRMGQPQNAIPHLAHAAELEPETSTARYLLGRALLEVGAVAQAVAVLDQVVAAEPDHAFGDALLALAEARERGGDDQGAAQLLARHDERYGAHRVADLMRGRLALRGGDAAAARTWLERSARAPAAGERLPADAAFARARARVLLWRTRART